MTYRLRGVNGAASSARHTGRLDVPPPTMAPGDLLVTLLSVESGSFRQGQTPPGWTKLMAVLSQSGQNFDGYLYYKIAGATELTPWSWSLAASYGAAAFVASFYSDDGMRLSFGASSAQTNASSIAVVAASVNAPVANSLLLGAFYSTAGNAPTVPGIMTAAGGATAGPDNSAGSVELGYETLSAAGATGARTATVPVAVKNGAYLLNLRTETVTTPPVTSYIFGGDI